MEIKYLVVHGTYTPPDMDVTEDDIVKWHVDENGWSSPGYHLLIRRDGQVDRILGYDEPGIHASEYNNRSLGIALAGGKGKDGWEFNYTGEQILVLASELLQLKKLFPNAKVVGHRDLKDRECPGFDVRRMVGWIM